MNVTPEKDVWLREGRTVYTLMHHGWVKGEEQFRNRLYFNLQYDHKTVTAKEAESVTADIVKAISAHGKLVQTLRKIVDRVDAAAPYTHFEVAMALVDIEGEVLKALAAAGEPV